jgi:glycerol-3-phosphate O-acyltransferase
VRYNAADLADAVWCTADSAEEQALRKLSRVLRVHFRRQRQMAIGPDLSHRNTQVAAVLAGEQRARSDCLRRRNKAGIAPDQARARAAKFATRDCLRLFATAPFVRWNSS